MSSENVAVIQALYEATGRGDVAAALALLDPDVEINYRGVVPDLDGRDLFGHAGVGEVMGPRCGLRGSGRARARGVTAAGCPVCSSLSQRSLPSWAWTGNGLRVAILAVWVIRSAPLEA